MIKRLLNGLFSDTEIRTVIRQIQSSFVLFLLAICAGAQAQEAPSIAGKWEQLSEMVHIEIVPSVDDPDDLIDSPVLYSAKIVRADWSPGRVGHELYKNLVYTGKNRWSAEEIDDNGKARKVRLFMKKDGYLHTTSYLDGRKRIRWTPLATDSESSE